MAEGEGWLEVEGWLRERWHELASASDAEPKSGRDPIFGGAGTRKMLDRGGLVVQMAKVIAGERVLDPAEPDEEARRRADEALARVEIFLGVDVDAGAGHRQPRARRRQLGGRFLTSR